MKRPPKTKCFEVAVAAGCRAPGAYGAAGDRSAEIHTLFQLATGLLGARQGQSAVPVLRPLLTACRQTGDRPREAQALLLLGATLVDPGSY